MYGYNFDLTYQVEASRGYDGVLYINPRGSAGYGQVFPNGCVKRLGRRRLQGPDDWPRLRDRA